MYMDTVINVVPNADSKKMQNHIFFNYIKNINFCVPIFCQDIFGCGTEPSSTKNSVFFRYNGRERWKSNILLHLDLLFKNRH